MNLRAVAATALLLASERVIIVAAAACVLPAWRASRLDPNAVLRG